MEKKNIEYKSYELGFQNQGFNTWAEFLGEAAKTLDAQNIPLSKVTKVEIEPDSVIVHEISIYSINMSNPPGERVKFVS